MMTKFLAFSAFLVLAAANPAIRGSRVGYLADQSTTDAALKAKEPLPQYSALAETGDGGACTLPSAQDAWGAVSKNGDGRVDRQAFSAFAHSVVNDDSADFNTYVDDLFTAGVSMMLPSVKTDLGSHCFGEISRLLLDYYGDNGSPICAGQRLAPLWSTASKDSDGRVQMAAFTSAFTNDPRVPANQQAAFDTYLESLFAVGASMMPSDLQRNPLSLGQHCFGAAEQMVDEFYF
jgi:hypothetical protein